MQPSLTTWLTFRRFFFLDTWYLFARFQTCIHVYLHHFHINGSPLPLHRLPPPFLLSLSPSLAFPSFYSYYFQVFLSFFFFFPFPLFIFNVILLYPLFFPFFLSWTVEIHFWPCDDGGCWNPYEGETRDERKEREENRLFFSPPIYPRLPCVVKQGRSTMNEERSSHSRSSTHSGQQTWLPNRNNTKINNNKTFNALKKKNLFLNALYYYFFST